MSGNARGGKSAKGGAKSAAKRHRKQTANSNKISGPAIRRLARRAGVPRVGAGCFPEVQNAAVNYLTDLLDCCRIYCTHSKRKTINCQDVIYALKRLGTKYMGF
ncbi:uncharacterized protein LOC143922012 [Arctopsyche grandis]|uniref:uncharacterized protein LOC143922012 n=1 Tax=Arctopsyche grandis TaxID=121162 RepID=UPI00406D8DD7